MKKPIKNLLKDATKTKAFRVGGYSVLATVIVLAILVAVNVLVCALPTTYTQLDATSNQMFSISEQTEQIVSSIDKEIDIYWVVRSGNEDEYIDTLLNRYKALSDKIKVIAKDPDVNPTFVQQYTDSYYDNSLIVTDGTRSRYVSYYDIYEYDYSNYYTTGTTDVSFAGESALTSAIDYIVNEDLPVVYVLTGHGEGNLSTTFEQAVEKENIITESLALISEGSVPEDADAVMLFDPSSDISADEKDILLEYLQNGGNLFLITDPPADEEFTNINELMAYYGVIANEGIVIEGDTSYCASGYQHYLLPDINSHEITNALRDGGYYIMLPLASGLTVSENVPDTTTVYKLLVSSSSSYSKLAGWSSTTFEKEEGDIDGPFAMAVAVEDAVDDENTSHIVWITSSAIADEEINEYVSGGNQDMFLNSLGWVCEQEESSLTIHAKELSTTYLTMSDSSSLLLAALVVLIIPFGFLAVGIVIVVRRKRR